MIDQAGCRELEAGSGDLGEIPVSRPVGCGPWLVFFFGADRPVVLRLSAVGKMWVEGED